MAKMAFEIIVGTGEGVKIIAMEKTGPVTSADGIQMRAELAEER